MSVGLIALLDDVAVLAKAAAASLDDVVAQAAKAGTKAAGVVIDDAAVTPAYVTGFQASRELPVIWRIAMGSLKNKLLILLPAALFLSFVAPWVIKPLLVLGGIYLCYEGAEKLYEKFFPHEAHAHEAHVHVEGLDAKAFEDQRVKSAVATDFILSAEIMAIVLSTVADRSFAMQAAVLGAVGLGITMLVYGAVALIVKADDAGVWLARRNGEGLGGALARAAGRGLVKSVPYFLKVLSAIGTAAMIWVGGGIILHGFEKHGLGWLAHGAHDWGAKLANAMGFMPGFWSWLVEAAASGMVGLVVGALAIPVMGYVAGPVWRQTRAVLGRA